MRVASRNAAGFSDYTKESSFTTDKIHADPVTGSASTATYVSSGATQIIGVIVLHHIVAMIVELKHNLWSMMSMTGKLKLHFTQESKNRFVCKQQLLKVQIC